MFTNSSSFADRVAGMRQDLIAQAENQLRACESTHATRRYLRPCANCETIRLYVSRLSHGSDPAVQPSWELQDLTRWQPPALVSSAAA